MQVLVGQRGVIGRFGGDEYVILLEKVETREQLKTLLKTIAKEFALAFDPKTHVTASIGVSEYPVDGSEYEELMRKADKALYLAKEKARTAISSMKRDFTASWKATICRTWLWPMRYLRRKSGKSSRR